MELAIGIIGILITLLAIKMQFFSKPREELEQFIIQFRSTQKLSLEVQNDLEEVIMRYNGWEYEMFPNYTYKRCLEKIKASYNKNLTDDIMNNFISLNPSKVAILSAIKSLETQFDNLMLLQANIDLISRQMEDNY